MKIYNSENIAAAIGPYSHAVGCGDLLFTSGQLPTDPNTGQLVDGGISQQGRQALANLKALLEDADSGLSEVVKVSVFLTDINDFKAINEIYAEFFGEHKPARSSYQVAALPLAARVEIECIARRRTAKS